MPPEGRQGSGLLSWVPFVDRGITTSVYLVIPGSGLELSGRQGIRKSPQGRGYFLLDSPVAVRTQPPRGPTPLHHTTTEPYLAASHLTMPTRDPALRHPTVARQNHTRHNRYIAARYATIRRETATRLYHTMHDPAITAPDFTTPHVTIP